MCRLYGDGPGRVSGGFIWNISTSDGELCTSEEALTRFVNALAETDGALGGSSYQDSPILRTRTPQNHRARAIEEAAASLEQAGI